MKIITISAISVLCLSALIILFLHIRTLKPLRSILLHGIISLAVMTVLNLLTKYTGIKIPINAYTVSAVGFIGIPAICGLLILNLFL